MSPSMLDDGVYPDVHRDHYDRIDRVNFSLLKLMKLSPAHYKHALVTPTADTDAKKVGRVVHLAAFEPERFRNAVAVWDGGTRRGKEWEAFKDRNEGRELLTENEYERCMAIQKAVSEHPIARRFVNIGKGEVTVLGQLPAADGTLVKTKGRLDFIGEPGIADLKVTKDGSPDGFPRQVAEYRYHTQAAWYVDLLASARQGEVLPYFIVSVEGIAPHVVTVYRVPDFLLNIGRAEYQGWLDLLLKCRKTSTWPGYADGPVELELPAWELRNHLEDELETLDFELREG
jgi:hypothetical protein